MPASAVFEILAMNAHYRRSDQRIATVSAEGMKKVQRKLVNTAGIISSKIQISGWHSSEFCGEPHRARSEVVT